MSQSKTLLLLRVVNKSNQINRNINMFNQSSKSIRKSEKLGGYIWKNRALISISFLIIIFIIVARGSLLYFAYQDEVSRASTSAKNTSISLDKNIESVFKKIDLSLLSVSKIILSTAYQKEKSARYYLKLLDFYKENLPEVFALRVADKNGKVIANTDRVAPTNINIADRVYFQTHRNNPNSKLYISDPIKSKFDGKMILTLSRRIPSADGTFSGILYAVVDLNYFNELIVSLEIGASGNVSILSVDKGVLLYRFPANLTLLGQIIRLQPETTKLIQSVNNSGEWTQYSSIDFKKKAFAVKINREFNYLVATGLAEEDFLISWRRSIYLSVFVIFFFTVCVIVAMVYLVCSQEESEKQKSELGEMSRKVALGRIANGIAHEINNPLAIIKGKSEVAILLMAEKGITDSVIIQKHIDISKMVQRISDIVKGLQILDQSNREGTKIYSLEELVTSAFDMVSQKMSDCSIRTSLQEIPDLSINCNKSQIVEVFIHILSNSIDAIKNNNDKWIDVSFLVESGQIQIAFTDSGVGIAKKDIKFVTDPFYTTKEPGQGIGLGLSVSEAILKKHSGALSYNSNSKNTQFIITLNIMDSKLKVV